MTLLVELLCILLSRPLILLFNQNPLIVSCGQLLLISQVALYPVFGLTGVALSQPAADLLTLAVCLLSTRPM